MQTKTDYEVELLHDCNDGRGERSYIYTVRARNENHATEIAIRLWKSEEADDCADWAFDANVEPIEIALPVSAQIKKAA